MVEEKLRIRIHGKRNKDRFFKAIRKSSDDEIERIADANWHGIPAKPGSPFTKWVWVLDVIYYPKGGV